MSWGLGQVEVHLSLIFTIAATSLALFLVGVFYPTLSDLRMAAATLPIVWVVSLLVRVAVQILAIGVAGNDLETVVGPTGNLSIDYERLDGPIVFSYAIAGQAATILLGLLGLMVFAALSPASPEGFQLYTVLEFQAGWHSLDWASQILWVNAFIAFLHILPAAPFDMRALIFGWWRIADRKASLSTIYRGLGSLNSHLACLLGGFGMAVLALDMVSQRSFAGWYTIFAPAVYLLVVSRWERSLASDIDDIGPFDQHSQEHQSELRRLASVRAKASSANLAGMGDESDLIERRNEQPANDNRLDVDNILRKLHREGETSLSLREKEALLSASRLLQAKRHARSNEPDK